MALEANADERESLFEFTGEDFVGAAVHQAHEGDPLLLSVLEPHDVRRQRLRAFERSVGSAFVAPFLLLFLVQQHAFAAAVAVDRDALAAAFPGRAVDVAMRSLLRASASAAVRLPPRGLPARDMR